MTHKNFILVVDDSKQILSSFQAALEEDDFEFAAADSIAEGKRILVQREPTLIISQLYDSCGEKIGLQLLQELKKHQRFESIPVALVAESLDSEIIDQAGNAGAAGMIPWPISTEAIRNRLSSFLTNNSDQDPESASQKQQIALEATAGTTGTKASRTISPEAEEKFMIAQKLLAKVLHRLKTSNLLETTEKENIPRIILEITNSICSLESETTQRKE